LLFQIHNLYRYVTVDLPRLHAEVSDGGEIVLGASEEDDAAAAANDDGGMGGDDAAAASVRPEVPEPAAPGLATMVGLSKLNPVDP
jgi:hypothetical protein